MCLYSYVAWIVNQVMTKYCFETWKFLCST